MTGDAVRTLGVERPTEDGGVWGSYVQYVKDLEEGIKGAVAAVALADSENPTVQALTEENERLRAHIFEVHTKRSCSVCKELNDRFAPATIDPAKRSSS